MNEIVGGDVDETFPWSAESERDAKAEFSRMMGGIGTSVEGTSGTGVSGAGSAGSIGFTNTDLRSLNKSSGGSPRTAVKVFESSLRVRADLMAVNSLADESLDWPAAAMFCSEVVLESGTENLGRVGSADIVFELAVTASLLLPSISLLSMLSTGTSEKTLATTAQSSVPVVGLVPRYSPRHHPAEQIARRSLLQPCLTA